MEDNNVFKSMKVVRIEVNKNQTVHLYFQKYNKVSEQFPSNRSYLIYYFDESVDKDFLKEYLSLLDQMPDKISLGEFLNQKGSKKKRKIIYYALVRFKREIEINDIDFQLKINDYLENVKNRNLTIDFVPLKETVSINNVFDPNNEVEDVDEDGFTTITANNATKNRHVSSKGLSFSVIKDDDSEDSIFKEIKENKLLNRKKQKSKLSRGGVFKTQFNDKNDEDEDNYNEYNHRENNDFDVSMKKDIGFYDIHNRAKQKRKYNELKALFDLDKKILADNN